MAFNTPILVVATDVPAGLRRLMCIGTARITQVMFEPVAKHAARVVDAASTGRHADVVIRTALRAPSGAAYLGIPTDLLAAPVSATSSPSSDNR